MNPLPTSINTDLPNNSILDEVKNPVVGLVEVAGHGVRFNLSRFQPSTTPLPPFTPPPNFGLEASAYSTSPSAGQDVQIDSGGNCESSTAIVVQGNGEISTTTSRPDSLLTIGDSVPVSSTSQNTFPVQEIIKDFSKLNKSDISELFHHATLVSHTQTNFLRTVQRKQQLHPQRYREDYLRHSSILLLSNGWTSAPRYSMCSVPNSVNRSGQCKLHKFCPYCSFLERLEAWWRYVPVFEHRTWFFLTGSFTGDLLMSSNNSYHELTDYWDAYKSGLQQLVKNGLVRGVFWTEELAVNSIAPVHTLPHIHATIEADELSGTTIEQLSDYVTDHLKTSLGPDCIPPNIHIKPLNTQRKLLSHIGYQIKPIKIVKAYDLAWSRSLHNERAGAVKLNSDATDLVLGYSEATKMRAKINHCGNLSPKTKSFIGTKANEMKQAQAIVAEVLREGVDRVEVEDSAEAENDSASI